jgi:hypothetical protein
VSQYEEMRRRGNPVAAFAVLRRQGPSSQRELPLGERLVRAEAIEAEKARRERAQHIREKRLTYPSNVEFFRALRAAQAGEEIEETGGEG